MAADAALLARYLARSTVYFAFVIRAGFKPTRKVFILMFPIMVHLDFWVGILILGEYYAFVRPMMLMSFLDIDVSCFSFPIFILGESCGVAQAILCMIFSCGSLDYAAWTLRAADFYSSLLEY